MTYQPPLRDMAFVLDDVLDAPARLSTLTAHADIDAGLMKQVLEEAGRFAAEVVAPLNAGGDREGCRFADGKVQTPAGFAAAYRQFCEAGWPALACATKHGGQGLPHLLNCALFEMLSAANHGWTMYPGLLHGAYACLSTHASDALKTQYLGKIVSGEWLATMCLTEAHAGSDLGLLRTRAVLQDDGSYRLSGDKIFISGGEQDMTDNIVHLVLARLPDAPTGSKGLSLFLVPKFLPDGTRNAVHCTGIEHKMGIRGSATCSMHFEQATGWLVGDEGRGLAAMFVMMNSARLHVGAQGLGIAEAAYQRALAYARERTQSRAPGRTATANAADPIVMQPAVQKLLMEQRCRIEGGRMLAYWSGLLLDLAEHDHDAGQRRLHHDRLEFITPVIKAVLTDNGFQNASLALQVFGGHGYVTETGIDQYLRDARITMIYEGSNEIQAIDFLLRKALADGGRRMTDFIAMIEQDVAQNGASDDSLATQKQQLLQLTRYLEQTTHAIAAASAGQPQLPYFIAEEMLRLTGHAAMAWLWLKAARSATRQHAADPLFYGGKRDSACYYFAFLFPEVQQLCGVVDTCLAAGAPAIPSDLTHHDAA
ncbi:acyl-CoA dehydrogenase [Herbaspirillum rhizosphaerae]|uniref:acyl-CoA dehydrogenase n=1 Tax=Herbaspirillum rhizosphaerae TaxID=346179 RepID=UPI00067D06BE|nr:acyl-CoA dehydrogenase [Herbaspirillum rhizosphaerae]